LAAFLTRALRFQWSRASATDASSVAARSAAQVQYSKVERLFCEAVIPRRVRSRFRAILTEAPTCIRRGYLVHDTLPERLRSTNAPVAYHVEATVLLLLTGAYVGIIPDQVAQAWVESGELHRLPLAEFHTERPLFLVKREGQSGERAAVLLFDAIAAALRN
jgi:DNA-binding transcriptional LysR family regulator